MLLASILDKIKNGFIESLSLELDTTIMFILDAKVGSSKFFLIDNFPCLFQLLVVNLKYSKIKTKLKMHVYIYFATFVLNGDLQLISSLIVIQFS